jgi:predicted nucleic acid-binding protein
VRFLVDANVLSEPTKPAPDPNALAWLQRYEGDLAIDPVILGELRFGVLVLARGRRRTRLELWFESIAKTIECLPWEAETGLRWAELLASLRASGKAMPIKDSLVAATALAHGLTMATRNRVDFEKAGVKIVNPFSAQ